MSSAANDCAILNSSFTGIYTAFLAEVLIIILMGKLFHVVFRRLGQPRILSELIVGILISNVGWIRDQVSDSVPRILSALSGVSLMFYMFVVGLEMDPHLIWRSPRREASIAYTGILSTLLIGITTLLIGDQKIVIHMRHDDRFTVAVALALALANTASPLLTRLTTELKIGKSEIGWLVVSAGVLNDMVSTLLMAFGMLIKQPNYRTDERSISSFQIFVQFVVLSLQTLFVVKVVPLLVNWVNESNPEGKPMKGTHLAVSLAIVGVVCSISTLVGYNGVMNAFILGLAFPREGRLSKLMTSKVNYLLSSLLFPLFFFWVGWCTQLKDWSANSNDSWFKLGFLVSVGTIGKVFGTLIAAILNGFQWPEAVTIGLLMNVKGHYHIFIASMAYQLAFIGQDTYLVMIFVVLITVIYIPLIVEIIVRRERRKMHDRHLALQWHNPLNELRVVLCLHGPHNVPTAINIIEATRGPANSSLMVYAMDLIELNERTAATLIHGEGFDAVAVTEESVVEMRQQITTALQTYVEESGEGLTVRRLLAISTYNNMHEDICNAAKDTVSTLIILPFHKDQQIDGEMVEGAHYGFKQVNEKVLRCATCSVGILVDRGLGRNNQASESQASLQAAIVFIGGRDDREALAYAGRVAHHPGIKLTAVRFLHDQSVETSLTGPSSQILSSMPEHNREMSLDDECFAEFYERHVKNGHVGYVEKYVADGAETVAALRTMEGIFTLFIVGRAGRWSSVLTTGMSAWEECPELGHIGDILAASDFSVRASVLIIQQQNPKRDHNAIDEEFSVM